MLKTVSAVDCFDYPDPNATELVSTLSRQLDVRGGALFVANGSESLIKTLPQVLVKPGDEVIIPKLTFPMFEIATLQVGGKVVISEMSEEFDIDLTDIQQKICSKTKLIFLCNPNNPTGKVLSKKSILNLVKQTQAFVIVDEANIEFGGETVVKEVSKLRNLIVLRTFSKGFGLAGLRIGFCVASPEIIQVLKMVSQPFPVNSLALKAAQIALKDKDFMIKTKRFMDSERKFLASKLRGLELMVIESQANNLLVKVTPCFRSSNDFVNQLSNKGVSVVNGTAFKSLGREFVRISPRSRSINLLFLKLLKSTINPAT
jgi:histidinol-phosphate aminotransferase